MKIVVAGGTGFLGRHIVRALLDAGHAVTVLGRDPSKASGMALLQGANATRGDVTDKGSLVGVLEGADGVVHAVQFPNYPMEQPRKNLTFDAYDRRGAENLLAEAARSGVGRFVYLSGAGANPAHEKTWYRAKGLAESAVRASGVSHAIVRPSWAYGPEDKALNRFVAIARLSPVIPQPGLGPQRIQPVHVDDVAWTVARIFETDAWGQTFEIGSREVLTMTEVIRTMCDVMGKRRVVVPVPAPLVKLATAPLTILPQPPLSPQGVEFAVQDGLVDISNAVSVLGFDPVPLRQGLERYLGPS